MAKYISGSNLQNFWGAVKSYIDGSFLIKKLRITDEGYDKSDPSTYSVADLNSGDVTNGTLVLQVNADSGILCTNDTSHNKVIIEANIITSTRLEEILA